MVLDSSSSSSSDFYDATPNNSPDLYDSSSSFSSSNPRQVFYNIKIGQLSKPFPLVGPLFGYTQSYTSLKIGRRLMDHSEVLGRPLRPPEVDSIAYHTNRGIVYRSYATPTAFTAGAILAWTSRDTSKMPFVGEIKKEGGWWDGERIRMGGIDMLKGDIARRYILAFRASVYGALGLLFGGIFAASYSAILTGVGELKDPNLKEFQQALDRRTKQRMGDSGALQDGKRATGQERSNPRHPPRSQQRTTTEQDDASPSAGNSDYESDYASLGAIDGGLLNDSLTKAQEDRQQPQPTASPAANRAPMYQTDNKARQSQSFVEDFDDASPTGESGPAEADSASAWDRIRRQASNPSAKTQPKSYQQSGERPKGQKRDQPPGDGFMFSSEEEDG